MRIAEIFRSLQGEGFLTGTESIFVRTSGCDLRCGFCDTRYASWEPEGESMTVDAVVEQVVEQALALAAVDGERKPVTHAVLTGGEPMIVAELPALCQALHDHGMHITIETAGTRFMPVVCDLMSVSPKLSNSTPYGLASETVCAAHERARIVPAALRELNANYTCQFKFVVDTPDDFHELEELLAQFPEIERSRVLLMPQGVDAAVLEAKAEWLKPYCSSHGMTYCAHRHIEWFGCNRGT